VAACRAWLGHQAEASRLSVEWGQVEHRLHEQFGWYQMSPRQRARHPGRSELRRIEDRLEELDVARDALLPTLIRLPATSPEAVALKLAVVAELVQPDDCPVAHALVVRAKEELLALAV
jgi:hypothetical protein